jgi:hypothetical protein
LSRRLEDQFQRQLKLTGIMDRLGDGSCGAGNIYGGGWNLEFGSVEQIEGLRSKLQIPIFGGFEFLNTNKSTLYWRDCKCRRIVPALDGC